MPNSILVNLEERVGNVAVPITESAGYGTMPSASDVPDDTAKIGAWLRGTDPAPRPTPAPRQRASLMHRATAKRYLLEGTGPSTQDARDALAEAIAALKASSSPADHELAEQVAALLRDSDEDPPEGDSDDTVPVEDDEDDIEPETEVMGSSLAQKESRRHAHAPGTSPLTEGRRQSRVRSWLMGRRLAPGLHEYLHGK